MKWWTTYKILRDLRSHLGWSSEEISSYRIWKLRELVRFVYFNSPFYRQLWEEHGFHPDQLVTIEDLIRLPITDKKDLIHADPLRVLTIKTGEDPKSKRNLLDEVTSGSTGIPLTYCRTWRDLCYNKAKEIRAFQQTGFRIHHRQVVLKSSSDSVTGRHWFENFGILRKYWLSLRDSSEHNIRRMRAIRPQHLHGYASGLMTLAEYLHDRGETLYIPIICTGAEVLDDPMRYAIKRAFKAEIFDLYGSREVGNIAWECTAHDGMHLNDDVIILELLDDQDQPVPDGVEGEVVVTFLDGRDYPFIRYRLGDRAVRHNFKCRCGVNFSKLQRVLGRSDERILLPSGEWLSGLTFQELRTAPWISAFRIIQDTPHSILLQVVVKAPFTPGELEALKRKTSQLVRDQLTVITEVLPELPYDKSGKLRAVICKLPQAKSGLATGTSTEAP
ncbi:MAG: hypothetical protein NTW14_04780 [bacterium]|nr:hypothetical protein [bacterium]